MAFHFQTIPLETRDPVQVIDITEEISQACLKSKVQTGLVLVASAHTTAAVRINEACEKLEGDLKLFLEKLVPPKANYQHNHESLDGRDNAHSHLIGYLMGSRETLAIRDGRLQLGSWQRIFFVELDGPREARQVQVTILGE